MSVYSELLKVRAHPRLGRIGYLALKGLGVEIPMSVEVGRGLNLVHGAVGLVVHGQSVIEDDVRIYQGVTLGRADIFRPASESRFEGIRICTGAVLCAGAKILCREGWLVVGPRTVVGANAVLTTSTGEAEIWVGAPARRVGFVDGAPSDG